MPTATGAHNQPRTPPPAPRHQVERLLFPNSPAKPTWLSDSHNVSFSESTGKRTQRVSSKAFSPSRASSRSSPPLHPHASLRRDPPASPREPHRPPKEQAEHIGRSEEWSCTQATRYTAERDMSLRHRLGGVLRRGDALDLKRGCAAKSIRAPHKQFGISSMSRPTPILKSTPSPMPPLPMFLIWQEKLQKREANAALPPSLRPDPVTTFS